MSSWSYDGLVQYFVRVCVCVCVYVCVYIYMCVCVCLSVCVCPVLSSVPSSPLSSSPQSCPPLCPVLSSVPSYPLSRPVPSRPVMSVLSVRSVPFGLPICPSARPSVRLCLCVCVSLVRVRFRVWDLASRSTVIVPNVAGCFGKVVSCHHFQIP